MSFEYKFRGRKQFRKCQQICLSYEQNLIDYTSFLYKL